MWDGVCMFFIYASFLEFILVNYLARWVQDPEQKKQKKDNAILDVRHAIYRPSHESYIPFQSLRMVTHTLDLTGHISQVTSMTNVTSSGFDSRKTTVVQVKKGKSLI